MNDNWLAVLLEFLRAGVLASFGAATKYLYDTVNKGRAFSWGIFFTNIFIAFFVGKLVGDFISQSNAFRDGYIMVAGFCSYPFLAWLEIKAQNWMDSNQK